MKYILPILIVVLLLMSVLTGCSTNTTTTPPVTETTIAAPITTTPAIPTVTSTTPAVTTVTPKTGGVLREVSPTVPSVIGWPCEETGANGETPQVCFDSFLRADDKGNIIPWLANKYTLADDHTSITFELRNDVKFHDGSRLDANVAKWNLDNQINAKQQPYWSTVEVLGDYTVRVNFKQWRNTMFLAFVDGPATWMCSKDAFDKNGVDYMRLHPVGTGPFKFVSFSRDTAFIADRNPDWWNKDGGPYIDQYQILYVTDPNTIEAMIQAGEADVVRLEPGKTAYDLFGFGLTVDTAIVSIFALVPDTANKDSIWANQKFREAVEYSINRESIAKNLGYGYLQAPNQMPPRTDLSNDPTYTDHPYNVAKAKELLAQSGYTPETKCKIIASPLAPSKDAILAIQSDMQAAGINVEIDFPEWSKYVTLLNGTWESGAALFQVFPVIGGPNYNATLSWYLDPTSGRVKSWEKTTEFVDLLNASASSPVVDYKLIRKVLNYIQDNTLLIPVHEAGASFAYQPYVKGGDWLHRSMTSWKSVEKVWLDK
jgi:peptide/nickel transport system substrate-binding protein